MNFTLLQLGRFMALLGLEAQLDAVYFAAAAHLGCWMHR